MIPSIVSASACSQRRHSTHFELAGDAGREVRLKRDERLPVTRPVLGELPDGVQHGLHHVSDVLFAGFVVQR